jgi:MarR family 2-MHQ and catechol resistance regulon transcriptional repressor
VAAQPLAREAAERLALGTFVKLMRAHARLTARVGGHLAGQGLTAGQFGVLETLWHLGPLCQHELGDKLLSSKPNISAIISNLQRDGLVRRQREAEDRRSVRVHLTPKGGRLIAKAFPDLAGFLTGTLACLQPGELLALGALCKKLGLALPPVDANPHP